MREVYFVHEKTYKGDGQGPQCFLRELKKELGRTKAFPACTPDQQNALVCPEGAH